jgi:hypothetical protein
MAKCVRPICSTFNCGNVCYRYTSGRYHACCQSHRRKRPVPTPSIPPVCKTSGCVNPRRKRSAKQGGYHSLCHQCKYRKYCRTKAGRPKRYGVSKLPEYGIWCGMIKRCENKNTKCFENYGGRGIRVCDRWRHSFPNFLADMGPRPSPNHSLDRFPDQNGDYEPSNVRWASSTQQSRNLRRNHTLTFNGTTKTLGEWASEFHLLQSTLSRRLISGWSVEEALTTPPGKNRGNASESPDDQSESSDDDVLDRLG